MTINLCKILKHAIGESFYCTILGEVILDDIDDEFIYVKSKTTDFVLKLCSNGKLYSEESGECLLYPNSYPRNWNNIIRYFPKDTLVMAKDSGAWSLFYYSYAQHCYSNGKKSSESDATVIWKFIVPLNEFDFGNLDYNVVNSICGPIEYI